jgi:hypothetical protein
MPHPSSLGLVRLNPRNKGLEGDVKPKFLGYGAPAKPKFLGLARNLGLTPLSHPTYLGLAPLLDPWHLSLTTFPDLRHKGLAIMPNPRAWGLTVFSNPSVLGLADMPNPNAWGLAVMSCLDVCCWLKAFRCGTIWKRQKHPYMQTCFCWVPRVISYLNCFNEMKRWWSPSTQTYIFPFFGVWMYLHCLFFSKTKKAPNPEVKILYLKGIINIYIIA